MLMRDFHLLHLLHLHLTLIFQISLAVAAALGSLLVAGLSLLESNSISQRQALPLHVGQPTSLLLLTVLAIKLLSLMMRRLPVDSSLAMMFGQPWCVTMMTRSDLLFFSPLFGT